MGCASRRLLLLIISLQSSASVLLAQGGTGYHTLSDFDQKAIIAVVAGVLGFLGNYFVDAIKKRREPRKELSFELQVTDPLIDVSSQVADKVNVQYGPTVVKNLYYVVFNVENTGNRVVKEEFVRFQFDEKSQILEPFFDPKPDQELDVAEVESEGSAMNEKRYRIGHLESGAKVGIRFVLNHSQKPTVTVVPFNKEGDVAFLPRSQKKAADDRQRIIRFTWLAFLWGTLPYLVSIAAIFPEDTRSLFSGFLRLTVFVMLLPSIGPVAKVIADAILARRTPNSAETRVDIHADEAAHTIVVMNSPSSKISTGESNPHSRAASSMAP